MTNRPRSAYGRTPLRTSPAVQRALDIIELLCQADELTLTAVAQRLRLPKSSTYVLLNTLHSRGYLAYSPATRTYQVGSRIWEAGQFFQAHRILASQALPEMKAIAAITHETTQLAVLDGREALYLAKVDSLHQLRLVSEVGRRLPARASAIGKVLLAGLPDDEVVSLFADEPQWEPFTSTTITSLPQLLDQLTAIRRDGYALDNQEYTPGVRCVAVPILAAEGSVAGALSTSMASVRWTDASYRLARTQLWTAAARVSKALGTKSYQFGD